MALFLILPTVVQAQAPQFETGRLVIQTASGIRHEFTVERATSPAQREVGLMHRTVLDADHGMLFDFGTPRTVMMWMKNTPLPLDMLFIDDTGLVIRIESRTTPFSESIIASGGIVRFVLEINGGRSEALGIAAGDQVVEGLDDGR
ncbi:DUF192 domain-containing protein [Agrobacterium sp. a22-2]|uniref:DUF192 domain-containing protein n=1 Tax=Agrobacterium sp. a22-2 TaxID=2283840 RepID=UPI001FEDE439|nr:DUF192 domain-containing protein [Agrobacterium sp. a22-2]